MRSLRSYLIKGLLRLLFKRQKPGALPVTKQREDFTGMMRRSYKPQPGIEAQAEELNGVAGEWSRHCDKKADRTLLYLHGGGYCSAVRKPIGTLPADSL